MTKSLYLKALLLIYLTLSGFLVLNAQIYQGKEADNLIPGTSIVKIDRNSQMPDYFRFRIGEEIPFEKFPNWLRNQLNLQKELRFELLKTEVDQLGIFISLSSSVIPI